MTSAAHYLGGAGGPGAAGGVIADKASLLFLQQQQQQQQQSHVLVCAAPQAAAAQQATAGVYTPSHDAFASSTGGPFGKSLLPILSPPSRAWEDPYSADRLSKQGYEARGSTAGGEDHGHDDENGSGSDDDRGRGRSRNGAIKRPQMQGRFSGRLALKEDEKRLVEECRLLAPLLGGQGKRSDKSRLTLAKIVRGIACGAVRRYCQGREDMLQAARGRITELEAYIATTERLQEQFLLLRAELEIKDKRLSDIDPESVPAIAQSVQALQQQLLRRAAMAANAGAPDPYSAALQMLNSSSTNPFGSMGTATSVSLAMGSSTGTMAVPPPGVMAPSHDTGSLAHRYSVPVPPPVNTTLPPAPALALGPSSGGGLISRHSAVPSQQVSVHEADAAAAHQYAAAQQYAAQLAASGNTAAAHAALQMVPSVGGQQGHGSLASEQQRVAFHSNQPTSMSAFSMGQAMDARGARLSTGARLSGGTTVQAGPNGLPTVLSGGGGVPLTAPQGSYGVHPGAAAAAQGGLPVQSPFCINMPGGGASAAPSPGVYPSMQVTQHQHAGLPGSNSVATVGATITTTVTNYGAGMPGNAVMMANTRMGPTTTTTGMAVAPQGAGMTDARLAYMQQQQQGMAMSPDGMLRPRPSRTSETQLQHSPHHHAMLPPSADMMAGSAGGASVGHVGVATAGSDGLAALVLALGEDGPRVPPEYEKSRFATSHAHSTLMGEASLKWDALNPDEPLQSEVATAVASERGTQVAGASSGQPSSACAAEVLSATAIGDDGHASGMSAEADATRVGIPGSGATVTGLEPSSPKLRHASSKRMEPSGDDIGMPCPADKRARIEGAAAAAVNALIKSERDASTAAFPPNMGLSDVPDVLAGVGSMASDVVGQLHGMPSTDNIPMPSASALQEALDEFAISPTLTSEPGSTTATALAQQLLMDVAVAATGPSMDSSSALALCPIPEGSEPAPSAARRPSGGVSQGTGMAVEQSMTPLPAPVHLESLGPSSGSMQQPSQQFAAASQVSDASLAAAQQRAAAAAVSAAAQYPVIGLEQPLQQRLSVPATQQAAAAEMAMANMHPSMMTAGTPPLQGMDQAGMPQVHPGAASPMVSSHMEGQAAALMQAQMQAQQQHQQAMLLAREQELQKQAVLEQIERQQMMERHQLAEQQMMERQMLEHQLQKRISGMIAQPQPSPTPAPQAQHLPRQTSMPHASRAGSANLSMHQVFEQVAMQHQQAHVAAQQAQQEQQQLAAAQAAQAQQLAQAQAVQTQMVQAQLHHQQLQQQHAHVHAQMQHAQMSQAQGQQQHYPQYHQQEAMVSQQQQAQQGILPLPLPVPTYDQAAAQPGLTSTPSWVQPVASNGMPAPSNTGSLPSRPSVPGAPSPAVMSPFQQQAQQQQLLQQQVAQQQQQQQHMQLGSNVPVPPSAFATAQMNLMDDPSVSQQQAVAVAQSTASVAANPGGMHPSSSSSNLGSSSGVGVGGAVSPDGVFSDPGSAGLDPYRGYAPSTAAALASGMPQQQHLAQPVTAPPPSQPLPQVSVPPPNAMPMGSLSMARSGSLAGNMAEEPAGPLIGPSEGIPYGSAANQGQLYHRHSQAQPQAQQQQLAEHAAPYATHPTPQACALQHQQQQQAVYSDAAATYASQIPHASMQAQQPTQGMHGAVATHQQQQQQPTQGQMLYAFMQA